MTKLEELKAACDADVAVADAAWKVAYAAYEAELEKTQEEKQND